MRRQGRRDADGKQAEIKKSAREAGNRIIHAAAPAEIMLRLPTRIKFDIQASAITFANRIRKEAWHEDANGIDF